MALQITKRHQSFRAYLKYTASKTNKGHYARMARAVRKGFNSSVIEKMREEDVSDDLMDFAEVLHGDYIDSQGYVPVDPCTPSSGWDGLGGDSGGHQKAVHFGDIRGIRRGL